MKCDTSAWIGAANAAILAVVATWSIGWAQSRTIDLPEPALVSPLGPPEAPESYLRMTVTVPLGVVRDSLEKAVPAELSTENRFETYEPGVELRFRIQREPFRLSIHRDTLLVESRASYTLTARGSGFEPVSCGVDEPLFGDLTGRALVGWGDGWRLAALTRPISAVYNRRCKPVPPGINFTAAMIRWIDAEMKPRIGPTIERVVAGDQRVRRAVEKAWSGLQEPVVLGGGSRLAWEPQRVVAGSLAGAGDSLTLSLAVVARARVQGGQAAPRPPVPLPDTRVRLVGDEFLVSFDHEVPFDSLGRRIVARCAAHGADGAHPGLRASEAKVAGSGDRVVVTVRAEGEVNGRWHLTGTPSYEPSTFTLAVSDLDFTSAARKALFEGRPRPNAKQRAALEGLRNCVRASLRSETTADLQRVSSLAGRALNGPLGPGLALRGGIQERRLVGAYVTEAALGVRLAAVGRATLEIE